MLEVVQQFRYGYKSIGFFGVVDVPVVTFAALVVITYPALATCAEVKPVLVRMHARCQWLRKAPDDDFYNRTVIAHFLGSDNWLASIYIAL